MLRGEIFMTIKQETYINKYNKEKYKLYTFRVKKSDENLILKLDSVSNRNKYITDLIRENINPSILTIKQIKEKIRPVVKKHGIREVYLFGSYARGEANGNSDVDLYCDSGDTATLIDESRLVKEFEEALGKDVDLVTIGSLMHPFFREQLEEDKIKIC